MSEGKHYADIRVGHSHKCFTTPQGNPSSAKAGCTTACMWPANTACEKDMEKNPSLLWRKVSLHIGVKAICWTRASHILESVKVRKPLTVGVSFEID